MDCWKHHFAKTSQRWLVLPQGNIFTGFSAFCRYFQSTHSRNAHSKTPFLPENIYQFILSILILIIPCEAPPNDNGFSAIVLKQCLADISKNPHILTEIATVASSNWIGCP